MNTEFDELHDALLKKNYVRQKKRIESMNFNTKLNLAKLNLGQDNVVFHSAPAFCKLP